MGADITNIVATHPPYASVYSYVVAYWLKPFAPSKKQLAVSFAVTLIAVMIFEGHSPYSAQDALGASIMFTIAWITSFNALLAVPQMTRTERILTWAWFAIISSLLLATIYFDITTKLYSTM